MILIFRTKKEKKSDELLTEILPERFPRVVY